MRIAILLDTSQARTEIDRNIRKSIAGDRYTSHHTSHIPHPTSHIPHPTSHIPHPTTSHTPHPKSNPHNLKSAQNFDKLQKPLVLHLDLSTVGCDSLFEIQQYFGINIVL